MSIHRIPTSDDIGKVVEMSDWEDFRFVHRCKLASLEQGRFHFDTGHGHFIYPFARLIDALLDSQPSEPQPAKRSAVEEMEAEVESNKGKGGNTDRFNSGYDCGLADAILVFRKHKSAIRKEAVDQFAERVKGEVREIPRGAYSTEVVWRSDVIAILDKLKG